MLRLNDAFATMVCFVSGIFYNLKQLSEGIVLVLEQNCPPSFVKKKKKKDETFQNLAGPFVDLH